MHFEGVDEFSNITDHHSAGHFVQLASDISLHHLPIQQARIDDPFP